MYAYLYSTDYYSNCSSSPQTNLSTTATSKQEVVDMMITSYELKFTSCKIKLQVLSRKKKFFNLIYELKMDYTFLWVAS